MSSDILFININLLFPGQVCYSRLLVEEKMKKLEHKTTTVCHNNCVETFTLDLSPKNLKSCFKLFPVIKGPQGYVLIDGHHNLIARIHLSKTKVSSNIIVPVKVLADLSLYTVDEFWKILKGKNLVHLKAINGQERLPPKRFEDLEDDPNRYLAHILSKKSKYQVWTKTEKSPPFIELHISDIFWRENIIYNALMDERYLIDNKKRFKKLLKYLV